jgi:hypothetical protein
MAAQQAALELGALHIARARRYGGARQCSVEVLPPDATMLGDVPAPEVTSCRVGCATSAASWITRAICHMCRVHDITRPADCRAQRVFGKHVRKYLR